MIDIRYTDNELTDCSWYNRDAIVGEGVAYMIRYFTGREQPNYPMPAIPMIEQDAVSYAINMLNCWRN